MPRLPRRVVIVGTVAAAALLLAGSAVVNFRADRAWARMQHQARELESAWQARRPRTPLWGEVGKGSAFVHYERALELAGELAIDDRDELVRTVHGSSDELHADGAALRARWQPVLAELRAGAHADDALPPAPPRGVADRDIANLLQCRWIASAAVFEAQALRHAGRHRAAVEHTLDAATFASDLLRRGVLVNQVIAVATLSIATREAWPEPVLAELDADGLAALAGGLDQLDRSLPEVLDQEGELLFLANALQQVPVHPGYVASAGAWRYGFSDRWLLADAFLRTLTATRALTTTMYLPWPKRVAAIEREQQNLLSSANPAAGLWAPNLVAAERNLREVVASLRLLRMAVATHRGIEPPPLRDPLGDGLIRVSATDTGLQLTCEGAADDARLARTVVRRR